jgi:hypothetical protein
MRLEPEPGNLAMEPLEILKRSLALRVEAREPLRDLLLRHLNGRAGDDVPLLVQQARAQRPTPLLLDLAESYNQLVHVHLMRTKNGNQPGGRRPERRTPANAGATAAHG